MATQHNARQLYLRLLRAWNERDAARMSACFADAGVMIGFDGSVVDGRGAIDVHVSTVFADHAPAAFVPVIRTIREVGDTALVLADVGMVPPGRSEIVPEANARQVMVCHGDGEGVRASLFQNTPAALHWDESARVALTEELNTAYASRGLLPE